jgi:hypothetical protein
MSEKQKKFNLVSYVYGELYKQQYFSADCKGKVIAETWKIYSWRNVLNWLQKNKHISNFEIKNYDSDKSVLTYTFDRNNLTYPYYLKWIEKTYLINSTMIEPMGTIVDEKKVDELASPDKPFVEYVERADSTTAELNKQITKELVESQKKAA